MTRIDSRAWIAWAGAAMLPALVGRNPFVLAEVLAIAVVVHVVWRSAGTFDGLRWFVRIAAVFTGTGVLFNVLTVHAGTFVFARLPERWPVIGGPLTVNALAYGIASGIALFTLVLVGTTVGSLLNWMDLFHALPHRLAPIAVAGSVAWTFLPQTAVAFGQIRESREMRGHRVQGVRTLLPLIVPLLAGAMDRALTTAEALEARGFGASAPEPEATRTSPVRSLGTVTIVAMLLLVTGAAGVVSGRAGPGAAAIAIGAALFGVVFMAPDPRGIQRTRYRSARWTWKSTAIFAAAAASALSTLLTSWLVPEALRFEPYPDLEVPQANIPLMLTLALLLVPALIPPVPDADVDEAR